jgi:hypothetical protein
VTTNGFQDVVINENFYHLLMLNLNVNKDMNCDMFKSCKKSPFTTQVSAMNNAIGFTTSQVK